MPAHRIVATAASARDARRLVEALSMHGVDGGPAPAGRLAGGQRKPGRLVLLLSTSGARRW